MKIFVLCLIIVLLDISCASSKMNPKKSVEELREEAIANQVIEIAPGEVRLIKVPVLKDQNVKKLTCNDVQIPVHRIGGEVRAFLAENYFSSDGEYFCELDLSENLKRKIKVVVKSRLYPEEELNVDDKRVELSKKNLLRVQKEQAILKKIYDVSLDKPVFIKPFFIPMPNKVSSDYGKKRIFNKKKKSQHLGTDFKSFVGENVFSSNAGKVVFVGDLFFSGGTVIIDHGLGIFTMYGHLSRLIAKKGEYLPQGAIVGLTGATGRVTGPHLHWGVKIHGNWVDGVSLIEASKTDWQ